MAYPRTKTYRPRGNALRGAGLLKAACATRQQPVAAARTSLALETEDSAEKPPSWGSGPPLEPASRLPHRLFPAHQPHRLTSSGKQFRSRPYDAGGYGDDRFH
jgi:hypothetical protein